MMTPSRSNIRLTVFLGVALFAGLTIVTQNASSSAWPGFQQSGSGGQHPPQSQVSQKPQKAAASNSNGSASAANDTGPKPRRDEHVVIISVDGMKPDYYTRSSELGIKVPTLTYMKLNGAYAEGVEGVYPTVTYPSHTAIVTGARPAVSGIVENTLFEPPTEPQTGAWYWYAKALKAETLWVAAKKAGMTVGSVGWPVTVGADIDYNVPEIWDPSEHPPTGKRTIENSTPGLIDKIIAAGSPGKADDFRTNATEFIIKNYKPNLVLLHLFELDDTEHKFGPLTPQAFETMEKEDGYIRRVVRAIRDAGIADKTTFFVVSDHGFAAISKTFEPDVPLVKAGLITLGPDGKPVSWKAAAWADGGSCGIVLKDPKDKETEKAVTELFSNLVTKPSSPVNRVILRKELDQLEAMPQAVIMLDANPGFTFEEALTGPSVRDSRKDERGTHGYLPSRAEMRSSLIIYGEDARVGERVSVARMIDIGPTAAAVLGLDLADAEGTPLAQMVKPGTIQPLSPEQSKEKRSNKKKRNANIRAGDSDGSANVQR